MTLEPCLDSSGCLGIVSTSGVARGDRVILSYEVIARVMCTQKAIDSAHLLDEGTSFLQAF